MGNITILLEYRPPPAVLYSVKILQSITDLDVCFAHHLVISACIANGQWLFLFCSSDPWLQCPSGLFINAIKRSRLGDSWITKIKGINCCHPKNTTPVYYHCYTKKVGFSSKQVAALCDDDYYLTGIHRHNIYRVGARFRCCKFRPPGMVDMNSFLVISFSIVMQSVQNCT